MPESITPIPPAAVAPTVVQRADLRPTADAAALGRNPLPDIPLPIPASLAPVAAVNKARLAELPPGHLAVQEVERTLKPYGVAMLPHLPTDSSTASLQKRPTRP